MDIYIKNMVCDRCILVVKNILQQQHIPLSKISLGAVELQRALNAAELQALDAELRAVGFELLQERKAQLVAQIKANIIALVHHAHTPINVNLSAWLSSKIKEDYATLSQLFTEQEAQTIEGFYIAQRIERAKELLMYGELSLSEIAYQLHYSSPAHFSAQFKKVVGISPSVFKQGLASRQTLDRL